MLIPKDVSNKDKIPYFSTSENLHQRETVFEDKELYIEDTMVKISAEETRYLRQVNFKDKPQQVQSEVAIVYRNPKNNTIEDHQLVKHKLAPKKKQRVMIFDRDLLTFNYQMAFAAGISLVADRYEKSEEKLSILVCGTGAAVFTMFLR